MDPVKKVRTEEFVCLAPKAKDRFEYLHQIPHDQLMQILSFLELGELALFYRNKKCQRACWAVGHDRLETRHKAFFEVVKIPNVPQEHPHWLAACIKISKGVWPTKNETFHSQRSPITCMDILPSGLVVWGDMHTNLHWKSATAGPDVIPGVLAIGDASLSALCVLPNSEVVVANERGALYAYDFTSGNPILVQSYGSNQIGTWGTSCIKALDTERIVVGCDAPYLWTRNSYETQSLKANGFQLPKATSLAVIDATTFAVGCINGAISIWSVDNNGKVQFQRRLATQHQMGVNSLAVMHGVGHLASCSTNGRVLFSNPQTGERLSFMEDFKENVTSMHARPGGFILGTASGRIWGRAGEACLALGNHTALITALVRLMRPGFLLSASYDGTIQRSTWALGQIGPNIQEITEQKNDA